MRNPLRSEAEAYHFLGVVIVGAAVIIAASFANTWAGVAVAVLAFAGLVWWLRQEPVPGAADAPRLLASGTPPGKHRVLVVAPPGTKAVTVPDGAEVLVVVPALAATVEALTGAVDDRRGDAASSVRTRSSWSGTTGWWTRSARGSPCPSAAPSCRRYFLPAEEETYFATAWICAALSFPLKDGTIWPPFVTWCATTARAGMSWSRFGPIVPVAPAAASVWHPAHSPLKIASPFVPKLRVTRTSRRRLLPTRRRRRRRLRPGR